jgi:hypothetical protein
MRRILSSGSGRRQLYTHTRALIARFRSAAANEVAGLEKLLAENGRTLERAVEIARENLAALEKNASHDPGRPDGVRFPVFQSATVRRATLLDRFSKHTHITGSLRSRGPSATSLREIVVPANSH